MASRRMLLRAFAVVVMGVAAQLLAPPAAAAPVDICGTWCWDHCPSDLNEFCHQMGCPGGWASCDLVQCHGQSGNWWNYRIDCGLL